MIYLDGELTLISPGLRHDVPVELLALLVRGVTAGLGQKIMGVRSTTLRRETGLEPEVGVGKEPDSAFYLGRNERKMRKRQEIDLNIDPPPDLAIEVENHHDLTASMGVYARLGVPEVWRYRVAGRSITINRLNCDTYQEVDRSGPFPRLTPGLIIEALDHMEGSDLGENAWLEWIKVWVRELPEQGEIAQPG